MELQRWRWSPRQHEIAVVSGREAVAAYNAGELSVEKLNELGNVRFFEFTSIPEVNAFIKGIDVLQVNLEAQAVDDLKK